MADSGANYLLAIDNTANFNRQNGDIKVEYSMQLAIRTDNGIKQRYKNNVKNTYNWGMHSRMVAMHPIKRHTFNIFYRKTLIRKLLQETRIAS